MVPLVVARPAALTDRWKARCWERRATTARRRKRLEPFVARRAQAGSKGLRMAGTSQSRAAARRGRRIPEKRWVCLCVSMWETRRPAVLQALDLGVGFGDDFSDARMRKVKKVGDEAGEGGPEGLAVGAERGDLFRRKGRSSVDEEDVAADFELRMGEGEGDGVVKEGSGGHEGGGGKRAGVVELGDGPVDAGGETEVVGVDDEGHESSVQRSAISVQESRRWRG
jgi:hypothetical protein